MQTRQYDLFGGSTELPPDVVARMTRNEKVAHILEEYPEARGNDRVCMLRYWEVFDGLRQALGEEGFDLFADAFHKITHPETVRRGRAEVQKLRKGGGSLLPGESVINYRRARDGAGAPGPRG
jgi:hypothetical protein